MFLHHEIHIVPIYNLEVEYLKWPPWVELRILVFKYEYSQFDPRWVLGVLDFEVVDWDNMNFMVQEQRASIMRRAGGMDWLKTLAVPAMLIAGTVIVALFILKFSAEAGASLKGGAGQAPVPKETGGIIGGAIDDIVTPAG